MTLPPARQPYRQTGGFPQSDLRRAPVPVGSAGIFSRTAKGETSYTTTGTFTFLVPQNVRYISAVCVGMGGSGSSLGGAGGGLAYRNRIAVVPGEKLTVVISATSTTIRRDGTAGPILCGATAGQLNRP